MTEVIKKDVVGFSTTIKQYDDFVRENIQRLTVLPEKWVVVLDKDPIKNEDPYSAMSIEFKTNLMYHIARNLNVGRSELLREIHDVGYVFMIEDDADFRPDVLERMMNTMRTQECDMVSLAFRVRDPGGVQERQLMAGNFVIGDDGEYKAIRLLRGEDANAMDDIVTLDASSFNCVLMKRRILEEIPFWGVGNNGFAVDTLFYARAHSKDNNHVVLLDEETSHRGLDWRKEDNDAELPR